MSRQRRFVLWNTEPATVAVVYGAVVVLLSESHLAPGRNFSLPVYTTYIQDRVLGLSARRNASGGTANLVHRRNSDRSLPPHSNSHIEACVVALCVNGSDVLLGLPYLPPRLAASLPGEWNTPLDNVLPSIITGDLSDKYEINACVHSLHMSVLDDPRVLDVGPDTTIHFSLREITLTSLI